MMSICLVVLCLLGFTPRKPVVLITIWHLKSRHFTICRVEGNDQSSELVFWLAVDHLAFEACTNGAGTREPNDFFIGMHQLM